jgi:uncharacterized protein YkwD
MRNLKFFSIAEFLFTTLFFLLTAVFSSSPLLARQQMSDDERQLFDAVNRERTEQSLAALRWDEALVKAARLHARRMAFYNVVEHQLSGEPDLEARLAEVGARFGAIAENIAVGSNPQTIHDGWMHSPGHRNNILNPRMTAVGIAAVRTNAGLFAVQDFTLAVSNLSVEEQEKKIAALLAESGWRVGGSKEEARKACETDQIDSGTRAMAMSLVRFETTDLSKLPEELKRKLRSKPFRNVTVGACQAGDGPGFAHFRIAVLLF